MKVYKLSELPEFKGKALALESQRLGLQSLPLGEMDATLAMLIGLMQVVESLQTEVQDLQDRLKKPEAESKFQASLVSVAEIAAALNCTPQTIRNYARAFGLGVRLANRWVFPKEAIVDIQVLMEKHSARIKVSP